MEIQFAESRLELIETVRAAETNLPVAVIQSARHRLRIMRAAPDLRTMWNWKSLGLQNRSGTGSELLVSLTPHWAMVVKIEDKNDAMTVIVKAMEEKLRGAA